LVKFRLPLHRTIISFLLKNFLVIKQQKFLIHLGLHFEFSFLYLRESFINNVQILILIQISFNTLQGFPTAKTLSGTSLVTTLPAPIVTLLPMVTPGSMTVLPPIQTLSPIFTGLA